MCATRRALAAWRSKRSFRGHQAFNICAPDYDHGYADGGAGRDVSAAGADLRDGLDGRWSGYDIAKAEKMLGFRAALFAGTTESVRRFCTAVTTSTERSLF